MNPAPLIARCEEETDANDEKDGGHRDDGQQES
jgi:hypothetical protein